MSTEETELTFVRCPSCRSLVPAVATRCRMCGQALDAAHETPPATKADESRKQSRVRLKTDTVSEDDVSSIVQSHQSQSADRTSDRLHDADAPRRSRGTETIAVFSGQQAEGGHAVESESMAGEEPFRFGRSRGGEQRPTNDSVVTERPNRFRDSDEEEEDIDPRQRESQHRDASPEADFGDSDDAPKKRKRRRRRRKKKPLDGQGQVEAASNADDADENDDDDSEGAEEDHSEAVQSHQPVPEERSVDARPHRIEEAEEDQVEEKVIAKPARKELGADREPQQMTPVQQKKVESVTADHVPQKEERVQQQRPLASARPAAAAVVEVPKIGEDEEGILVGWLVSFDEDSKGVAHELRAGRFFIGHEKLRESDYTIVHSSISTPHCMVHVSIQGGMIIQDLMSEGGTFIKEPNDSTYRQIAETRRVPHGSWLKLGEYEVLVSILPPR